MDTDFSLLHFVEMSISIDDEKDLDQAAAETLASLEPLYELPGSPPEPVSLVSLMLMAIAAQLPGELQYNKALLVSKDVHELDQLYHLCWHSHQQRSFGRLRRLGLLHGVEPEPYDDQILTDYVKKAWGTQYHGQYPDLLLANIRNMSAAGKNAPYGNQVTIIQSSGTGKSRMVHEMAKSVFTIPFNIRSKSDEKGHAHPLPDDKIRDYLLCPLREQMTTGYYAGFFASVFEVVNCELDSWEFQIRMFVPIPDASGARQQLAAWWSRHLENDETRKRIYDKIVQRAQEKIGNVANIEGQAGGARRALDSLLASIATFVGRKLDPEIVIYFDEAHTLVLRAGTSKSQTGRNRYDVLCKTAADLSRRSLFLIFLSTNSSLPKFAPARGDATSERIFEGQAIIHAPITEVPFDCYPEAVKTDTLSLVDTASISFLARFGRPLFWTMLEPNGKYSPEGDAGLAEDKAILLAMHKIVGNSHDLNCPTDEAALAVIDIIIMINYEPRRMVNRELEHRLIQSHARIAFTVPEHREYVRSGYPSEPLIAEAASRLLYSWQCKKDNDFFDIDILNATNKDGRLDKGSIGEMTARLILSRAYGRAIVKEANGAPPNFSAGCSLLTFINQLFADDHANMICTSVPDNAVHSATGGQQLKDHFKNAVVRFTHFTSMECRSTKRQKSWAWTNIGWAAFIRSAAIICHPTQPFVDLIIPILLSSNEKIGENAMSGLLIQVKNQLAAGTTQDYMFSGEDIALFPSDTKRPRPYICLVMELGVAKKASGLESEFRTVPPKLPPRRNISSQGPRASDHERYHFFAYGRSTIIYKNVDANKLSTLLGTDTVLDEHARQDEPSLSAICTMKPFWKPSVDCYSWTEGDATLKRPTKEIDKPEIVVRSVASGRMEVD